MSGSSDPFDIVPYYTKQVTTFCTDGTYVRTYF